MKLPNQMELQEGYAHFAPEGVVTLDEGVKLVTNAIKYCRFHNIYRLLVDTTKLTGFPPPMIHERYWLAQEWAHEARGGLILAVVAREENLDPHRFGVLAARNAGLRSYATTTVEDALAWLQTEKIG